MASRALVSWPEHFRNLIPPNGNWCQDRGSTIMTVPVQPVGRFLFPAMVRQDRCEMVSGWSQNRKPRLGAVCAVMLVCVLASVAQDPGSNASTDKQTTAKKPTSASSSASHTSSSTSPGKKAPSKARSGSAKRSSHKKTARARGQQKIDSDRAQAIQAALIREHYLNGAPSGTWNQASEDAMRRYQEDNGWQSKTVPDSRALIKLGLGPSKEGLLNPESAMTSSPDPPKSESTLPTSHSAPPDANPGTPAQPSSSSQPETSSSPQ
jgi:hypothetical protein